MRVLRAPVLALIFVACSQHPQPPAQPPPRHAVTLEVAPAEVSLDQGATQPFSARLSGGEEAVAWSLAEGAAGGAIAADGTFQAPMSAGDYHVIATAAGATATATVHVKTLAVSITPPRADLLPSQSVQLAATVSGAADKGVIWSAPGGGSIDANGLYYAPSSPGVYHAIATSRADPARSASAEIAVSPAPMVAMSIDPSAIALKPGGGVQFTATVAGTSDIGVVWLTDGGAVDASGAYVAPKTPGQYHVTAISHADPSRSVTAQVRVDSDLAIALTPSAARVEENATLQLTASVTGDDKRVAWSVSEPGGGSVDASGIYRAPHRAGVFHVVATSVADPSRSVSASIAVVVPPVSVRISPVAITVNPDVKLQFAATAPGLSDTSVQWSSDCCTVAQDGSFTAPHTAGVVHLTARSVADPAQSATATITVEAGATIDPAAVTLAPGDKIAFASSDSSATWSVLEGSVGGTIANGAYQAPRDHDGTFHVVATGKTQSASAVVTVLPPDLVDRGGAVVSSPRTFAIFWGAPPADLQAAQETLLQGLGNSEYLQALDPYLRGASAGATFGGSFLDSSAPPASPDKADTQTVGAEACAALLAGGVMPAAGDVAIVYGASALSPAPSWCAWHASTTCNGAQLLVAFVPDVNGSYTCMKLGAQTSCNALSDAVNATASLAAHELVEAMTDPLIDAWADASGGEIADKCEDQPGCVALSGGSFWLQSIWSNDAHACMP